MKISVNLLIIAFALFAFSCGKGSKGTSSKRTVTEQAVVLNDSAQKAWSEMMESDDRKIESIGRLLNEISYTKSHNEAQLLELQNKQQQLKRKRYQQKSMTSTQIDNYDASTDSLVKGTIALVNATPEMENHSITQSLINDIQTEDNNVIVYRIRYDRKAKELNEFVTKHSEKLSKAGNPYNELKPLPVFELQTASQ